MKNKKVIEILDEVLSHYVPDGNPEVWKKKILEIKHREETPKKIKKLPVIDSYCGSESLGAWCAKCDNQSECNIYKKKYGENNKENC